MQKIILLTLVFLFGNGSLIAGKVDDNICAVFVADARYYHQFKRTLSELRGVGEFTGDVCLIPIGKLTETFVRKDIDDEKLIIKSFPQIPVLSSHKRIVGYPAKIVAQMQKLHLFNQFFKDWDYILYLDSGMHIHGEIKRLLDHRKKDRLVAHSDCYPTYEWTQEIEFINDGSSAYQDLVSQYNLRCDYFQSGLMIFDTSLIKEDTFDHLLELKKKYPFGAGDQSYISLYFCHIVPVWEKIPIEDHQGYLYDICPRGFDKYVMHKTERDYWPCAFCRQ